MQETAKVWKQFIDSVDSWQTLITQVIPRITAWGDVYELENFLNRPNESFAIVNLRTIGESHYHKKETEIYIILQGKGIVIVADQKIEVVKGTIVIIPPNTVHYAIPTEDFVLAIVSNPVFSPDDYYPVAKD